MRSSWDFLFENKNKVFNDYPCSDYLHNALHFISQGKIDAAYDEICHVIIRSGGKLTKDEQYFRNHMIIRGNRAKVMDWSDTKETDISVVKDFLKAKEDD